MYLTASRGRAVGSFVEFVKSFGSDSKNVCPRAECTERKACASPPPEAKLAVVAAPYRTALHHSDAKVGLRKNLWRKLSPLRLGYLAWNKRELAAWLGHIGLEVKEQIDLELENKSPHSRLDRRRSGGGAELG